jgi:hypothetical protein
MSDMAKSARAAMKAKAQRLGTDRPLTKVDSSSWSPAELLNADVKTGLRPISKRQFKKGGKVTGKTTVARADRKARKSGGRALSADSLINRDVREANEQREGKKHVGGFKKGGAAKRKGRDDGGKVDEIAKIIEATKDMPATGKAGPLTREEAGIKPGSSSPAQRAASAAAFDKEQMEYQRKMPQNRKAGGRTKKAAGGDTEQFGPGVAGAADMMKKAAGRAGVPGGLYGSGFNRVQKGALSPLKATGMKKGGSAKKHEDEAEDKALIKKMVKSSARTGKAEGGSFLSPFGEKQQRLAQLKKQMLSANPKTTDKGTWGDMQAERSRLEADIAEGSKGMKGMGRTARATGGEVFSGAGYPNKVPGVVPGGRDAHARGGKTGKGKTNINIVIAAGKPAQSGNAPDMGGPAPGGMPVPVPPPQAGTPMGAPQGAPMPMPAPGGGAPGGMPPGMPPLPRKSGGRISKVAKSYEDMTAGAGSGEGRLQKTDIAKRHMRKEGGQVGHRTYRSYRDMDAGAGSGFGRLEKTEIQKHK